MQKIIKKADVLIEALPYIQKFKGKVVVIKYGGAVMENDEMRRGTLEDIVFMNCVGMKPVLVHGGGPFINEKMKEAGKRPKFIDGHRVTDKETAEIVYKTLSELNKKILKEIKKLGVSAFGLSGELGNFIKLKKQAAAHRKKFGYVGEIDSINPAPIKKLIVKGNIPVVCPIAADNEKRIFNINADQVSSYIAISLKAEKLVLLTDTKGIMMNEENEDSLISTLNVKEINGLIKRGLVSGGMLPKVKACVGALNLGVNKTHIIDGRIPHSLLLEIFTDKGIGTEIIKTT